MIYCRGNLKHDIWCQEVVTELYTRQYFLDNCLGVGAEESLENPVKTACVPTEILTLNVSNASLVTSRCTNRLFFPK
jgi:hypothetical protein